MNYSFIQVINWSLPRDQIIPELTNTFIECNHYSVVNRNELTPFIERTVDTFCHEGHSKNGTRKIIVQKFFVKKIF